MIKKDIITFEKGGLDWDTALSRMLPGDSRNIENSLLYASESGNVEVVENVKGNTREGYCHLHLNSTTVKVIGACKDKKGNSIIYFIYDSTGKDTIVRYDVVTKDAYIILQQDNPLSSDWETTLNFSPDYPIKARVIGTTLVWVSGQNPPRSIDIDKAVNFSKSRSSFFFSTDEDGIPIYVQYYYRTSPLLYYYNKKTYGVWIQRAGVGYGVESMIYAIDHTLCRVSDSYGVGTGRPAGTDPHAFPAVIVADDGHIIVAHEQLKDDNPGTGHNSMMEIKRSDYPEDETSWVNAIAHNSGYYTTCGNNTTEALCYPKLYKLTNGNIIMFARRNLDNVRLYISIDHGVSFNAGVDVVDIPGNYHAYNFQPTRGITSQIDMVVTRYNEGTLIRDEVYYLKSIDGGTTWTDVAGGGSKDVVVSGALTLAELQADDYRICVDLVNGVQGIGAHMVDEDTPYVVVSNNAGDPTHPLSVYEYSGGAWNEHITGIDDVNCSIDLIYNSEDLSFEILKKAVVGSNFILRKYKAFLSDLTTWTVSEDEIWVHPDTETYSLHEGHYTFNYTEADYHTFTRGYDGDVNYNDFKISVAPADRAYTSSDDVVYSSITTQLLDFIKHPPTYPPSCVYDTDNNFEANHLRNKLFQFSYRYIYDDWGKSVYSSISDVALPSGSEFWFGEIRLDYDKNNMINIQVFSGEEDVSKIELIGREGNDGVWFLIDVFNKEELNITDEDYYTYAFYNNKSQTLESQIAAGRLFDYIPQLAESLEVVEDNRVILSGATENYEKVDVVTRLTPETEQLSFSKKGAVARDYKVAAASLTSNGTHLDDFEWELDESGVTYFPMQGHILEITIDGEVKDYYITAAMVGPGAPFDIYIDFIEEKINTDFTGTYFVVESPDDVLTIRERVFKEFELDIITYLPVAADAVLKYTGFKTGAHHPFCVIYYDLSRRTNGAHTDDNCDVYIDFYTEPPVLTSNEYRYKIEWEIHNKSPIWATHWQWGYAKNSTVQSFVQYPVGEGAGTAIATDTDRHITTIDIVPLQTINDYTGGAPPDPWHVHSSLSPYVFNKGDRVRFITQTPPDLGDEDLGALINITLDLEILGLGDAADVGVDKLIVEELNAAYIGGGIGKVDDRSLMEIYNPKKENPLIVYYAYGDIYEIENPGTSSRMHKGSIVDQEIIGADTTKCIFRVTNAGGVGDVVNLRYDDGGGATILSTDTNPGGWTVDDFASALEDAVTEGYSASASAGGYITVWKTPGTGLIHKDYTYDTTVTGAAVCSVSTTYSGCATGVFTKGDVYHILRVFNVDIDIGAAGEEHPVIVETPNYSDFYSSDTYPIGRPMIELEDNVGRGLKSTLVRHGGIYIPNTQINNLAEFEYDDYTTKISEKEGDIYDVKFKGDVLKVFQAHKKTSIYIGKREISNADGSTSLVATDVVFGSIRRELDDSGTIFPNSIISHFTHIYYFDIYKGAPFRDAYNGTFEISYKMKRYFAEKSRALLNSGIDNIDVKGVFNEQHGFYILTFIDSVNSANNETIAFHEASNRWISFYGYEPELYSSFGETMASFNESCLFIHNSNDIRCNFYGIQYKQKYSVTSHGGAEDNKLFKTIHVYSNKKWSAPASGDIIIPITETYPRGMSSRLKPSHFINKEGIYEAAFLKNELTTNSTASRKDLINGELLRGSVIKVDLENSETGEVVLKRTDIGFDV